MTALLDSTTIPHVIKDKTPFKIKNTPKTNTYKRFKLELFEILHTLLRYEK